MRQRPTSPSGRAEWQCCRSSQSAAAHVLGLGRFAGRPFAEPRSIIRAGMSRSTTLLSLGALVVVVGLTSLVATGAINRALPSPRPTATVLPTPSAIPIPNPTASGGLVPSGAPTWRICCRRPVRRHLNECEHAKLGTTLSSADGCLSARACPSSGGDAACGLRPKKGFEELTRR